VTYPNADHVLRDLLGPVMPVHPGGKPRVVSVRPADLSGRLPLVQAGRVGGGSSHPEDRPFCEVTLFADPQVRGDGQPLAERLRQRLEGFADVSDGLTRALDGVEVRTGPVELEYPGQGPRVWRLTVELRTRDVEFA